MIFLCVDGPASRYHSSAGVVAGEHHILKYNLDPNWINKITTFSLDKTVRFQKWFQSFFFQQALCSQSQQPLVSLDLCGTFARSNRPKWWLVGFKAMRIDFFNSRWLQGGFKAMRIYIFNLRWLQGIFWWG